MRCADCSQEKVEQEWVPGNMQQGLERTARRRIPGERAGPILNWSGRSEKVKTESSVRRVKAESNITQRDLEA